jgi:hypothetical protein
MTQKDFYQNQGLEEILRERANHYSSRKKIRDFWVLTSPNFLFSSNLSNQIKNSNFYFQKKPMLSTDENLDFYAAILSTNKDFINWMQVRLGSFENLDEKISSNKQTKFDGIFGKILFQTNEVKTKNPLQNTLNFLQPEILLDKNKEFLKIYYKDITKKLNQR